MKYFTIFASRNDIDDLDQEIEAVFASGFKIAGSGNEFVVSPNNLFNRNKITLRIATEDSAPDYFERNIPGMMGFYENIPFEDENLQQRVIMQISVINTMIAIETDKEYNDSYRQLFYELVDKVGGIGFLPDATLIDRDGRIIVHPDGTSGPAEFKPQACTRKVRGEEFHTPEGEQRKQKSLSYLKDRNIPFVEHLPQLPPIVNVRIKSQEEIARRAIALLIVIQYACDVAQNGDLEEAKQFVFDMLSKYGVEAELTENERQLLQDVVPDQQAAVNIAWQYEAYWVLIWALGLVDTLAFPDQICDCDYAINVVASTESFAAFMDRTALRSGEEILDEADKIYRLHWACVNSRIQSQEAPAGMNESIVVERRRGLFWLIGDQNEAWDHIRMDT